MNRPLKRTAALCFGLVMAGTVSGCGSETTSASQSQSLNGSGSSETAQYDQPHELFDPGPKSTITVTNPGKDPEVRTYRFRVGDTVTRTEHSSVTMAPTGQIAPGAGWTNTTRSQRTIISVEDGVATIRDVVEAADTSFPKSSSPQSGASMDKGAAALVGHATYLRVGSRGEILGINTHEATGAEDVEATAMATLPFPMPGAVGSGLLPWPKEPVGVGATWTQVSTEEVPGTATTATTTSHVTLVSIDSGVATLNSTSTVTYTPRSKSIGTVEGTGEGTSTSTVTLGDFLHQATHNDSKLRTKMTASTAAGLTQEVTVDTKTKG